MFKVDNEDTKTTSDAVLVSLLITLNIFHTFFYCFYCYFEQINDCCKKALITAHRYKQEIQRDN